STNCCAGRAPERATRSTSAQPRSTTWTRTRRSMTTAPTQPTTTRTMTPRGSKTTKRRPQPRPSRHLPRTTCDAHDAVLLFSVRMIDATPELPEFDRCDTPSYRDLVRAGVSDERFAHIERVVELAVKIGEANGFSPADLARVELAALLHDAARDLDDATLVRLAPPQNQVEVDHPLSVHGRAGRRMAEGWGVTDEAVLEAIEGHVFGVPLGNPVGTAVYVADVCEPGRGVNATLR